jgi:hypothetical protein
MQRFSVGLMPINSTHSNDRLLDWHASIEDLNLDLRSEAVGEVVNFIS